MIALVDAMFRTALRRPPAPRHRAPPRPMTGEAVDRHRLMAIVDMQGRAPWRGVD